MVDCGSASAFTYAVCPYLRSRGVTRLDGLVLTHGDAQHIGGTTELLSELDPAEVVDSPLRDRSSTRKALHAALEASGLGKTLVARGDVLTLAPGVVLRVLFPPPGYVAGLADDKALVLRLDADGKRLLLSSDAGFLTETWLLENAPADELRCDVWIKQRHHSDFSGTPDFLAAARPSVIVASGAETPAEAERDAAWAAEVEARGIRLLRQDATGAVHVALDARGHWTAEPFLPPRPPK
jgi:competence protein ComEC